MSVTTLFSLLAITHGLVPVTRVSISEDYYQTYVFDDSAPCEYTDADIITVYQSYIILEDTCQDNMTTAVQDAILESDCFSEGLDTDALGSMFTAEAECSIDSPYVLGDAFNITIHQFIDNCCVGLAYAAVSDDSIYISPWAPYGSVAPLYYFADACSSDTVDLPFSFWYDSTVTEWDDETLTCSSEPTDATTFQTGTACRENYYNQIETVFGFCGALSVEETAVRLEARFTQFELDEWTDDQTNLAVSSLAAALGISVDDITVRGLRSGSVILDLEVTASNSLQASTFATIALGENVFDSSLGDVSVTQVASDSSDSSDIFDDSDEVDAGSMMGPLWVVCVLAILSALQ